MSKSKVVKVNHDEFDSLKYSLHTSEAFLLLKERGLTKADNEQVVQRWLKEGKIDTVLVKKGPQTERGYRINEVSLLEYAEAKGKTRSEWKQELDEANLKIAKLEDQIKQLLEKEAKIKKTKLPQLEKLEKTEKLEKADAEKSKKAAPEATVLPVKKRVRSKKATVEIATEPFTKEDNQEETLVQEKGI